MVKIAIAGASSQVAREVLDKLVETQKHDIIALNRKNPSQFPSLRGVEWVQTAYQDKSELVRLLKGVHTVLCFFVVHLDPGNNAQKRLIDAAIEAGVKRYAPSEWSTGARTEDSIDILPQYANKIEIRHYLENLNKERKVLEYTTFQPGSFMDYLGHPHKIAKHITTIPLQINVEKRHALVVQGSLDRHMSFTTVQDIGGVVARAVEYEGDWPVVGGMRGSRVTIRELLKIAEKVRGEPFTIEWLKLEDLEAGVIKSDNLIPVNTFHSTTEDEMDTVNKLATIGMLVSACRGAWDVTNEWNQILPDYEFTQVEDFLTNVWAGK